MTVTQLASLSCRYQTTFLFKSCSKRNDLISNISINVPLAWEGITSKVVVQFLSKALYMILPHLLGFCQVSIGSIQDEPLISWELSPVKQKHLVSSPSSHQQSYMRCFQGRLNVRCIIQLCFFFPSFLMTP